MWGSLRQTEKELAPASQAAAGCRDPENLPSLRGTDRTAFTPQAGRRGEDPTHCLLPPISGLQATQVPARDSGLVPVAPPPEFHVWVSWEIWFD